MGKKQKEILDKEFVNFEAGMVENGFAKGAIAKLWETLIPFADYAFNRAHSAGYGVVSFWTAYLKANFPEIWKAGGNIRGNDTYRWWTAYRRGDRSPTVMHWWNVTRPAWIARHFRDHRLPGVIAQIKWGTVGTLGVAGMKRVVEDAIRKKY
jgi:hypothetical protein